MSENPGGTPPSDDQPADLPADQAAADTPAAPEPPFGDGPPVAPPPPATPGYPPPPGQYPPPGGQYPPPAPGQYAPPPGGYAPPPGQYAPPPGGYGAPVAASPLGEALSYGWRKFTQNGATFVLAGLVWIIAAGIAGGLITLVFGGFASLVDDAGGMGGSRFNLAWIVVTALWALLAFVVEAVFIRAALRVTYGRTVGFGDFFDFTDLGPVVLAALVLAGVQLVLGFVGWIPLLGWAITLVVNFLLFFTLFFVIDKKLPPVDAIRASVNLIRANLGTTILFVLVAYLLLAAGAILCGIGLFVAVPVVLLASAYYYRRLLGEPVAP